MIDTGLKNILKTLPAAETNILAKCFLCRNSGALIEIDYNFVENAIRLQQKGINIMLSKAIIHLDQDLASEFCIRMPPRKSQSIQCIGAIDHHFRPIQMNSPENEKNKESISIAKRPKAPKLYPKDDPSIKEKYELDDDQMADSVIVPHYVTNENRENTYELNIFSLDGFLSLPSQYLHAPSDNEEMKKNSPPDNLDIFLERFLLQERLAHH